MVNNTDSVQGDGAVENIGGQASAENWVSHVTRSFQDPRRSSRLE